MKAKKRTIGLILIIILLPGIVYAQNFNINLAVGSGSAQSSGNFKTNLCVGSGSVLSSGNFKTTLVINSNCLCFAPLIFSACYTHADCNDFNPCTHDTCNKPGTLTSHCANTPHCSGNETSCGCTDCIDCTEGSPKECGYDYCMDSEMPDWYCEDLACKYRCVSDPACSLMIPPNITALSDNESLVIRLGSTEHITVKIKNNLHISDTITLTTYGSPNVIENWVDFGDEKNEIILSLEPKEEKTISFDVFAGKTGIYNLKIFAESQASHLYSYDIKTIHIVNKDSGVLSRSPGLAGLSILIILLMGCVIAIKI